jgi:micrococcal nuclease
MRLLPFVVVLALGCGPTRPTGVDGGGDAGRDGGPDASRYDPILGNPFDGPIELADPRVEAVDPSVLGGSVAPCRAPILGRVTRIIDGDTVFVNGVSEAFSDRVRMIGVDTPELNESPTPPDCFALEARTFTEQLQSRLVWLTFDRTCLDPYDRHLAYVWIGGGPQDMWERQLLRRGFARELIIAPNDAYEEELDLDQYAAMLREAGLWGACP